jgi:hypothetical protein
MMYMKGSTGILAVFLFASSCAFAQEPGWPRQIVKPTGTLVHYAPQVDDWKDFQDITWRQAITMTPTGGKQVVGGVTMEGTTNVDNDNHMVVIYNLKVLNTYFPSADPNTTAQMDALVRTFIPETVTISLERVVASVKKPENVSTVALKNDPPFIFISYSPAILLAVDGEPVLAKVPETKLKFVVNTHWPLFFETEKSEYFLLVGQRWLIASDLHGPWSATAKLPKDMEKLPKDAQWASLKGAIPPPQANGPIPKVFYSAVPAEVILFSGPPTYARIPQTQLVYATNTDSPLFLYQPKNEYYYLAGGRWFRSTNLEGTWTFASLNLPPDFANIPLSSPASGILASVPGTDEAKDAVLIAQIPTTMILNPKTAAEHAKVTYSGTPHFVPIEGTSMQYATNTADKVIQVGGVYYLCLQGVWFMSAAPEGPWTTAGSVPQVIYTIPVGSPVYNVTYVTQTTTSDGNVKSSYTAGYLGAFIMGAAVGAIVANGTGYYYPPYLYYPTMGYPIYHPYPTPYGATGYYNNRTGAYGYSQTAYGAYGSATRAAQYNPYTGTYARGASTSTAYGRQSVAQAYNPYTGTYAASHQGSSPTAQWGQSYVSQGNRSAYTQHYSTAQGTVASAEGSQGGSAYGTSSKYGTSAVGKSSSGEMYAGHDGNVYKSSGSGSVQKYNNSTGSWNTVNTQQAQQKAQQQHSSMQASAQRPQSTSQERSSGGWSSQNLSSEMKNRSSGAAQSDRFNQYRRSGGGSGGGGSWGGGHSWGGFGGGGRSFGGGGRRR